MVKTLAQRLRDWLARERAANTLARIIIRRAGLSDSDVDRRDAFLHEVDAMLTQCIDAWNQDMLSEIATKQAKEESSGHVATRIYHIMPAETGTIFFDDDVVPM